MCVSFAIPCMTLRIRKIECADANYDETRTTVMYNNVDEDVGRCSSPAIRGESGGGVSCRLPRNLQGTAVRSHVSWTPPSSLEASPY